MLLGEAGVQPGGPGRGPAAPHGRGPLADAADENRDTVPLAVPPPNWLRHEHPATAHPQTGRRLLLPCLALGVIILHFLS